MMDQLHPGARVRVTEANRVAEYTTGDRGRVVWVNRWESKDGVRLFYLCEMVRPGKRTTVLFCEDEIECDSAESATECELVFSR